MDFTIRNASDKEGVVAYINALPEGRTFTIKVKREVKKRTIPQNKLYWLWLGCIADETGNDIDALHQYFVKQYLGVETMEIFGEVIERPLSTTKLNTEQFTEYLEKIRALASEMDIILPQPDDLYWDAFYEHYGQER